MEKVKTIRCDNCEGITERASKCEACNGRGYVAKRLRLDCGCYTWMHGLVDINPYHGNCFRSLGGLMIFVCVDEEGEPEYFCKKHKPLRLVKELNDRKYTDRTH